MIRRRGFLAAAAGAALGGCASGTRDAFWSGEPGRRPMRWKVRHSLQVTPEDAELRLAKQLGLEYVHTWSSPAKYKELVARVEAAGLRMAKIGNNSVHNRPELALGLPGRDAKIEEFNQNLRALAAAGIRHQLYAHMATGTHNTGRAAVRGGALARTFEAGKLPDLETASNRVVFDHAYTEKEMWEHWEYFVRRIAPVAEETGVRIGVHPDDPPGLTLGNVPRCLFSSFEGYRRALEIADSPNIGVGLCCGTWLEGGETVGRNVLDMIEYFGRRRKLFVIHFRNIDRPLPNFRETFLNDGFMDMYRIIRKLAEVNFDGVLSADHVPSTTGIARAGETYTVGYIQALIERANEEVFF
ncbi:MAG: mannonate dehydratase [Planctomycetes bacterium]|nr:mannonate dehydratase [Planctomycetota bacterium]